MEAGGREGSRVRMGPESSCPSPVLDLNLQGIRGWMIKFVLYLQGLLFV